MNNNFAGTAAAGVYLVMLNFLGQMNFISLCVIMFEYKVICQINLRHKIGYAAAPAGQLHTY